MSIDPDRVAQCAQLAMLFELSASPKPGNVDRCHDFSDIGFHHFLVSAVSAYPVFRAAASGNSWQGMCSSEQGNDRKGKAESRIEPGMRPSAEPMEGPRAGPSVGPRAERGVEPRAGPKAGPGIGCLILEGVKAWSDWNIRSNTHFGSLVLMIPLAVAAGRPGLLRDELISVLNGTTVEDSLDFYRAFSLAGARIVEVDEFSLNDQAFAEKLYRKGETLRDLMCRSQVHDLIAREWATCYERSFRLAARLEEMVVGYGLGLNEGIVRTFLEALADVPDSLVQAKFGAVKARDVSLKARLALDDKTLDAARRLDRELLAEDVNPGSTADLIAASLFISLLKGLRF